VQLLHPPRGEQVEDAQFPVTEPLIDLSGHAEGGGGQLGGLAGAQLGAGQADVELNAEGLQRPAGVARLAAAFVGELALSVVLARGVLGVAVSEEPDHAKEPYPQRAVSER
jgi:hypothetical protein